ncbi:MAG TPA: aminotransferase class I/II-fold pyridoxal phosphate-dependent enzyme [Kofleriaceae bacterium]|jgi:histidinol-phosphate aminotransferase|nr:aminotransferase class I/II-fold pyridoxal phosphate-dependent enzyme [Kofleriaceae bacterium]
MSDPLAQLINPGLRAMSAYHVPRPEGIVAKLDANEMPFALPADLAEQLGAELAKVALERYPLADGGALRGLLAREVGVSPDQVVLGNGSDELIALVVAAFSAPRAGAERAAILYPTPTFVVYRMAAIAHQVDPVEVPLRDDFTLDLAAVEHAIATRRPNVCFFALPNNPTGTLWPPEEIAALAARHPDTIVVSDEAYIAYGGRTLAPRLPTLRNLIIMRTLSKIGMASLRVGWIAASPALAAEVEKARPPYNVGALNQRAAEWLLEHARAWLDARAREVVTLRESLVRDLRALPALRVFDTEANLVMVKLDGATRVWEALASRGVLVRNFDRPGPLSGCLRITVGTASENAALTGALRAIL